MSETGLIPLQAMAIAPTSASQVVPAIVAAAGDNAARRYLEFFAVTIENPNTRQAYFHACRRFFDWCERKGLDELVAIEPMHDLDRRNQELSAVRPLPLTESRGEGERQDIGGAGGM